MPPRSSFAQPFLQMSSLLESRIDPNNHAEKRSLPDLIDKAAGFLQACQLRDGLPSECEGVARSPAGSQENLRQVSRQISGHPEALSRWRGEFHRRERSVECLICKYPLTVSYYLRMRMSSTFLARSRDSAESTRMTKTRICPQSGTSEKAGI